MTAQRTQSRNKTTETLVELPSNQFARTALEAVAERRSGGLVYLYGIPGVGKTLLANQFVQARRRNHRNLAVQATTAADFAAAYAESVDANLVPEFISGYRQLQLLVLEDLQALERRRETQQQVIFTLDDTLAHSGIVVITASRLPGEIPDLLPKLRNRCRSGTVAEIVAPPAQERLTLVTRFCQQRQLAVSQDGLQLIAQRGGQTPRELQAAINGIHARANLFKARSLDESFVSRCLADDLPPQKPTVNRITRAVARHFGVSVKEIRSSSRARELVLPRQCAMYLARELTSQKLTRIASYFGRENHSAVSHACRRILELLNQEPALGQQLGLIRNSLL